MHVYIYACTRTYMRVCVYVHTIVYLHTTTYMMGCLIIVCAVALAGDHDAADVLGRLGLVGLAAQVRGFAVGLRWVCTDIYTNRKNT